MKRVYFLLLVLFPAIIYSQSAETVKLNKKEIETIFLNQNLVLIAEKMNISMADAEIIQAKVWDNPTLTISDVNLWTTGKQRETLLEAIPAASHTTQFAVELSQLLTTAGKRRKGVAVQQVSKEMAVQQFSETLRGLKTELRKSINDIIYYQNLKTVLSGQADVLARLINAYEKQVKDGNLSKAELLRLQSSSLEIESGLNQLNLEINALLKTLKSLLNLPPATNMVVIPDTDEKVMPPALVDLYWLATENRPDMKLQKLQTDRFAKTLHLEKARRVPDIMLSANYDRCRRLEKLFRLRCEFQFACFQS